jgi:hypothetical protein
MNGYLGRCVRAHGSLKHTTFRSSLYRHCPEQQYQPILHGGRRKDLKDRKEVEICKISYHWHRYALEGITVPKSTL